MGDVDDFFNRKQKKKMKNKTKKVVTATDIFNEETEGDNDRENNTNNVRNNLVRNEIILLKRAIFELFFRSLKIYIF
jgi:hypothetical protein